MVFPYTSALGAGDLGSSVWWWKGGSGKLDLGTFVHVFHNIWPG